jgi:hypothetical protein
MAKQFRIANRMPKQGFIVILCLEIVVQIIRPLALMAEEPSTAMISKVVDPIIRAPVTQLFQGVRRHVKSLRVRSAQLRRKPFYSKLFSVSMMVHGPTLLTQTALNSPSFIDIEHQRFLVSSPAYHHLSSVEKLAVTIVKALCNPECKFPI